MKEKTKFIGRMKKGRIQAGVTENEYGKSINISKSFFSKKDNEWKYTNWFSERDLFDIMDVCHSIIDKYEIDSSESGAIWNDYVEGEDK